MKKLLFLILLTIPFFTFCQENNSHSKTISKEYFEPLECEHYMRINAYDTAYHVFCNFDDYEGFMGWVDFWDEEELSLAIEQIEQCLPYMDKKKDEFSVGVYSVLNSSKNLIIYDEGEDTYSPQMKKKTVLKWLNWLKTITL